MSIRRQFVWVLLLSLLSPVVGAKEPAACDPWAAKIASIQGNVEARRSHGSDWQSVKLNELFCPGDQIRVGDKSRAGVILANETLVRLDENTAITLTAIEKESFSLVEILKGIAHFISRVPRSLKVNTPFVNAAIEGTEFVVAIANQQTTVTVFEGTVLTQNDQGELRITNGESAVAKVDTAPSKTLLARPRDTVQWALYFPPIIDAKQGKLAEASRLLYTGRVQAAKQLLETLDSGEAKALQSIIAVVNNDRDRAFTLATDATQQAPQSATTHIALSYAWQAKLELNQSLASATEATRQESNNAIAWARLAELQLSVGELDDALASAQQATNLNPHVSRTQSILGYAYLVRIDIEDAITAFNMAIKLDQADPLPRLGLGLAKIRKNRLQEGRRDIEVAALLDPNNAIIRSYLGKAYFEEKRGPLDATQFDMAKALDPNDPTPYYYDAIRRQTENNPVGALEDLNKSIELNDNRSVYRSSLQLDQDEAARSASQARIYQDLGFEQLAVNEASKSISQDPTNYSAHELLADSYLSKPRHEIARVSESLQSRLLNPLNPYPQQPQINQGSLTLLNNLGPNSNSHNEYNNLFRRNGFNFVFNGLEAGNNTDGFEAIASGLYDRISFSAGTYEYNTDGFHTNNGQELKVDNIFLQAQISNDFSLFFEKNRKNEVLGDLYRFDPANFLSTRETTEDVDSKRFGVRKQLNANNTFIASYLVQNSVFKYFESFGPGADYIDITTDDSSEFDARYFYTGNDYSHTIGVSKTNVDGSIYSEFGGIPFGTIPDDVDDSAMYIYSYINLNKGVDLTLGLTSETYTNSDFDISNNSPKFGILWTVHKSTILRLAYTETLKRYFIDDATLEPTMIAGFNQFYNDTPGTKSSQTSAAADFKINNNLNIGLAYTNRDLDVPDVSAGPVILDMSDDTSEIYLNWVVSNSIAISTKLLREKINRGSFAGNDSFEDVLTYRLPININLFFNENFRSYLTATYVKQEGNFIDVNTFLPVYGEDNFWHVDLGFSYLLPKRTGSIVLGVKNLFDEKFNYEETDRKNPVFSPERIGFARINLNI